MLTARVRSTVRLRGKRCDIQIFLDIRGFNRVHQLPDYKISRFRRKLRSETLEYCVTYRIEFLFLKYWNLKSFVPLFGYSLFDYALNEVWGVMCEVESQMVNFIFWKYRIFFFIFLRNLKLFSHRINTLGLNAITKLNWKKWRKKKKRRRSNKYYYCYFWYTLPIDIFLI